MLTSSASILDVVSLKRDMAADFSEAVIPARMERTFRDALAKMAWTNSCSQGVAIMTRVRSLLAAFRATIFKIRVLRGDLQITRLRTAARSVGTKSYGLTPYPKSCR